MNRLLIIAVILALSACAPPVKELATTYDPQDVAFSKMAGQRTVSGQAMLRQRGGGVVTCAGTAVNLIPYTEYAKERLTARLTGYQISTPADPNYVRDLRTTICDAQGNFTFEHIPPGDYYVTAQVTWQIPTGAFTTKQGGDLVHRLTVADQDVRNLVITR